MDNIKPGIRQTQFFYSILTCMPDILCQPGKIKAHMEDRILEPMLQATVAYLPQNKTGENVEIGKIPVHKLVIN